MNDSIQIGLFSATMPKELQELTKKFLEILLKFLLKLIC